MYIHIHIYTYIYVYMSEELYYIDDNAGYQSTNLNYIEIFL